MIHSNTRNPQFFIGPNLFFFCVDMPPAFGCSQSLPFGGSISKTQTSEYGFPAQVVGPHSIYFGGWRVSNGANPLWNPICQNSVSIFNLNSFSWTDSFDPNAKSYTFPQKIVTWSKANASPSRGWDSGVQAIFSGFDLTGPASVEGVPKRTLSLQAAGFRV